MYTCNGAVFKENKVSTLLQYHSDSYFEYVSQQGQLGWPNHKYQRRPVMIKQMRLIADLIL